MRNAICAVCVVTIVLFVANARAICAEKRLFWLISPGFRGPDAIWTAELDGGDAEEVYSIGSYQGAQGLAVNDADGRIYWTDFQGTAHGVRSCRMDGTDVRTVVQGRGRPFGIAVDPVAQKVYWADLEWDQICRSGLDGGNVEVLLSEGVNDVGFIALDVPGSKMYWTVWGGRIMRADLDGSDVETLIPSGLERPIGIALDLQNEKMYFCEDSGDRIGRANLDGTNVETVLTGVSSPTGIALDLEQQTMYWTQWYDDPNDTFSVGSVRRAGMDGTDVEILAPSMYHPCGIGISIPEPATLTVLCIGGLAVLRRRKKQLPLFGSGSMRRII